MRKEFVHGNTNTLNALGIVGRVLIRDYPENWKEKLKGLRKKPNPEEKATKIKARSSLILPLRSLEVKITGRAGSDTDTQSRIAIEYGLRDDITIGISNLSLIHI